MYKYLLLICFFVIAALAAHAQKPNTTPATVKNKKDTIVATKRDTAVARSFKPTVKKKRSVVFPDSTHSPHVAVMHSLMVPGWGQVYNHQLWKVPIIYGGIGLLGVAIIFNARNYNEFLALSIYREHGTIPTSKDNYYTEYQTYISVPDQSIYDATDGYRRDRDLCILGVVGAWGINVVDAYINAKFIHSYTMNDDLSMKVTPALLNQPVYAQNFMGSYIPGIKITFTVR
jgi:hypothetical protein